MKHYAIKLFFCLTLFSPLIASAYSLVVFSERPTEIFLKTIPRETNNQDNQNNSEGCSYGPFMGLVDGKRLFTHFEEGCWIQIETGEKNPEGMFPKKYFKIYKNELYLANSQEELDNNQLSKQKCRQADKIIKNLRVKANAKVLEEEGHSSWSEVELEGCYLSNKPAIHLH